MCFGPGVPDYPESEGPPAGPLVQGLMRPDEPQPGPSLMEILDAAATGEAYRRQQMTHLPRPKRPTMMEALDAAALGAAPIPVVGDLAGLGVDAYRYATQPESRNWMNYGLSALGALPFVPPLGGMVKRVYHGTPNKWASEADYPLGRPRMDKIGTGEGAQAYGYGIYGAEAQGVAREIRDRLSDKKGGHLYDLGIDDDDAAKMMDWDAPLSEQPKNVQEAVKKMGLRVDDDPTGGKIRERATNQWYADQAWAFNRDAERAYSSDRGAAEMFREAGIPGLKYYDQWSRKRPIEDLNKTRANLVKQRKELGDFYTRLSGAEAGRQHRRQMDAMIAQVDADIAISKSDKPQTRNYVIWDQDVLNRIKVGGLE